MNKNQEELERIIIDLHISCVNCNCFLTGIQTEKIAQVILSAGFVKLDSVELDEEKIEEILRGHQGGLELHIATHQGFNKLAHAIAQTQPIKVKEGR